MIDRIRNWRLPVRYKVPPRNDLIAFALMALAFGLMVGLAIAPGWGTAGSTGPVIALPAEEPGNDAAETAGTAVTADLQPPAGGEPTTPSTTSDGFSAEPVSSPASTPVEAPDEEPVSGPPGGGRTEPLGHEDTPSDEGTDEEPALVATVVAADQAGYAVADASGNLLYLHNPLEGVTPPPVGRKIGTGIEPLGNGTFQQDGGIESRGPAATSKLTGVVSWADPDSGVITVSARGASLALQAADAIAAMGEPPVPGSVVTGVIAFGKAASRAATVEPEGGEPRTEAEEPALTLPKIKARSLKALGEPQTQVELAGPVEWDPTARALTVDADGFGALNRQVTISVPKKLALKGIQNGQGYAISADLGVDGALTLSGLSANFSRKAASNAAQAFGTHAR